MNVKVPFLADGIDSGTVVNILVAKGDKVKKDQILLELETDKAVAPIPSTGTGTVKEILVKAGDKVSVGQSVVSLSGDGGVESVPVPETKKPQVSVSAPTTHHPVSIPVQAAPAAGDYVYESKSGFAPPASPTVRKMARDLGIDLTRVKGSEHGGRITESDLKNYIQHLQQKAAQGAGAASGVTKPVAESIDFSKWGPVSKKPMTMLRSKIAQKMSESWTTIPHVTQFDEADITVLMELMKKHNPDYEKAGAKLTLTTLALKASLIALQKFPAVNASLDEVSQEVVTKEYYHLGVAVDTDQGLIVPVIRDVDKKDLVTLQKELGELAERTRQRKVGLEELKGGTFTISNLGGFGVGHFTPIVNKPEAAILGLGRGVLKPVIRDNKLEQRIVLPVCLSYDHRLVDGALGARFIREIVQAFENFKEEDFVIKSKNDARKKSK